MMQEDDLWKSPEFQEGLAAYERAKEQDDGNYPNADMLGCIADYYDGLGRTDEAIAIADLALDLYPGSGAPLYFKGRVALHHNDDPKQAETYSNQIVDKNSIDYLLLKLDILLYENKTTEAETFLKEVYDRLPDDQRDPCAEMIASMYLNYDHTPEAKAWLARSSEKKEHSYRLEECRIAENEKDYARAEKIMQQLIDEQPYNDDYWNRLGTIQMQAEAYERALESSEYSLAINPDNDATLTMKGKALVELKRYDEALDFYQRYQQKNPDDMKGELSLGIILTNLERYDEAVMHYQKAQRLAEDTAEGLDQIYIGMAQALSKLQRADEAMSYIDKLAELDEVEDTEVCTERFRVMLETHWPVEEVAAYVEQALATYLFGKSWQGCFLFYLFGKTAYECHNYALCYGLFQRMSMLTDKIPKWYLGFSYYAICSKLMKSEDEFKKALRLACRMNPAEAKEVLGDRFPDDVPPESYYDYYLEWEKLNGEYSEEDDE